MMRRTKSLTTLVNMCKNCELRARRRKTGTGTYYHVLREVLRGTTGRDDAKTKTRHTKYYEVLRSTTMY